MPRRSYRARGPAAPNPGAAAPNPSPAAPNPNPIPTAVAEVEGELPHVGAFAIADALDDLHVGPDSHGDGRDLSEIEAPALPHPLPVEASSSVMAPSSWSPDEQAIRKLHELAKVSPKVMLTQEEATKNDERQVDEISVLESIYEGSIDVLGGEFGQRSFQISVSLDITDGIDVVANFNSGDGDLDRNLDCKIRMQHLAPILLTCLLPASYPSHNPPLFTLATQWLDKKRTSSLCVMLDNIWSHNVNDEVVHLWLDDLRNSSLSHLGCGNNEIVLSETETGKACDTHTDQRACSASTSLDLIIPFMMRYNEDKCHKDFLEDLHDCSICFSNFSGVNFIKLPCRHFFCLKCMETYCKMIVNEGKVMNLVCPDAKCESAIPTTILKKLLGKEEFDRWDELLLQKTLEGMSDIAYCPRCQTPFMEDPGNEARCSSCCFSFCTLCENHRHVGKECISLEERLLILEKRQRSGKIQGNQSRTLDELRNIFEIKKDAKQCPKCRMAISKTEGCNKMACTNCGQLFCYQCCTAITGYDHFSGSCALFAQEAVDRWEMQMDQIAQDEIPAQITLLRCPTCDQPAAKIRDNNSLFCSTCNQNFCAECLKVVKDATEHYGPNGCSLHS